MSAPAPDATDLLEIAQKLFNRWSNSRVGSEHRVIDDQDAAELRAAIAKAEDRS